MFDFCKDIYVSNQKNKVKFKQQIRYINRFITIYPTFEYTTFV